MKAIDILNVKCDEICVMINSLADNTNKECEDALLNLQEAVFQVKMKGVEHLDGLVQELETIRVDDWKDYSRDTILILTLFLKSLAARLNPEDWEADIDEINEYVLTDLQEAQGIGNIFYCSSDDPHNEMVLINCENTEQIVPFLERIENVQEMILRAVKLLCLKKQYRSILVAKESTDEKKRRSRIEYLKMYAVLKGETFHIITPAPIHQVSLPVEYNHDIEYSQYSEIIDVLNEYNAQIHIVDKYLRIYQVIENFMYKTIICELCELKDYERLTLSDFKAISDRLQTNEKRALAGFLEKALKVEVAGKSFTERLKDSWNNCFIVPVDNLDKAEVFVQKLGIISNSGSYFNVRNIQNNVSQITTLFAEMIYKTRCSIVHNKVNEYHITYTNLNGDIKWVIENYLIPNMVDITFGLMLNQNDVVMFKKDSITLM